MKERLKRSSISSNFWNNFSTVVSGSIIIIMLLFVKDPETIKQVVLAYLASSGVYNAGNIAQHFF